MNQTPENTVYSPFYKKMIKEKKEAVMKEIKELESKIEEYEQRLKISSESKELFTNIINNDKKYLNLLENIVKLYNLEFEHDPSFGGKRNTKNKKNKTKNKNSKK